MDQNILVILMGNIFNLGQSDQVPTERIIYPKDSGYMIAKEIASQTESL